MQKAYAKVNIYLHVLGKREDGFHDLESLMVPVDLYDELEFFLDDEVIVKSDIKDNIITKAAYLLKEMYHVDKGARIEIKKNIPIGAGLAGGSADASATLRGLNELWELGLSLDELAKISLLLGSDTAFCMYNKPAIVRGRGEKLQFVDYEKKDIILFCPDVMVSTKNVFANYHEKEGHQINDLEETTIRLYPQLNEMKKMFHLHEIEAYMSGSGSTFYSFDLSKEQTISPFVRPFILKIFSCKIL